MPDHENNHPMKEFVRELTELQPALRAFVRDLQAGASQTPDGFQGANLFTPGTHFRAWAVKSARCGVLFSASCLGSALSVRAAPLVHEPFDYTAGSNLTSQTGGSGWADAWTQTGEPCVTGTATTRTGSRCNRTPPLPSNPTSPTASTPMPKASAKSRFPLLQWKLSGGLPLP